MVYVIDTHALIWYFIGSARLSTTALEVLRDTSVSLVVPTMVLAEARHLSLRGRVTLPWDNVIAELDRDSRCVIFPLGREVVQHLPVGLSIHDAIICATALLLRQNINEQVTVITADRQIAQSGLVRTLW